MSDSRIPINSVTVGNVYTVDARNLRLAVYVGEGRFVGIRTKFGRRFLDAEWHWEAHERLGTLWPLRIVGVIPKAFPSPISTCTHVGLAAHRWTWLLRLRLRNGYMLWTRPAVAET
jgi:hypothetical protein